MSRIGLIGENSIEYINKLLEIWNGGDCAVLIDWRIPYRTAVEMMKEADVSVCYLEDTKYDIQESSSEINFIIYRYKSNSAELLPTEIYDKFENNYSPNEAIVIYSSGTTGKVKGIILSHFAINTNADAIIDYVKPSDNDCLYIAKVLSHSSTLTGELLVALKTRIKLVIAPTIVPPRFVLKNIKKFNVNIICVNPTLLQNYAEEFVLGKYILETLKTIYVSGSILSDKIYALAHTTFKDVAVYNVYGLSETGPRVTAQRPDCCKNNTVGRTIKNVEVKIVGDDGKVAPRGKRGAIHINTQSLFNGYILGKIKHDSFYMDWYNSGDVGYFDENDELNIVGRQDDLITINSYKVYPDDIEKRILDFEFVKECKIFYSKNFGISCVYVKSISNDIEKKLIFFLQNNLPYYEVPKKYYCVDEIPKNLNNKINIKKLEQILEKNIKI